MTDDTKCKQWLESENGNQIAGDHPHNCDGSEHRHECLEHYNVDVKYTIHARVVASFRGGKTRGPFEEDTCYRISGTVFEWFLNPCNEKEKTLPNC